MVSIYGTFLANIFPGATSSMLRIELAGSMSFLARTRSIKRTAWRLASLYKYFGCRALKLWPKTSNKLRIGSARPKSVVGAGKKGNRYRFQVIFTKRDECHFVVGVSCSVIYPLAPQQHRARLGRIGFNPVCFELCFSTIAP